VVGAGTALGVARRRVAPQQRLCDRARGIRPPRRPRCVFESCVSLTAMVATFGTGAWHRRRVEVREDYDRLVAYALNRSGALRSGAVSSWRWASGLIVTIVARAGSLMVTTGELVQQVPIEWESILRSHRRRPWFACPLCSKRAGKFYYRGFWACAECHDLREGARHLNRWMTHHSVGAMLGAVEKRSRSL
jgi:hypothetical protein